MSGMNKAQLIGRILGRKMDPKAASPAMREGDAVTDRLTRFDSHPGYKEMQVLMAATRTFGVDNPFFRTHEGLATSTTTIGGRRYLNFSSYDYLGLNGHPEVNRAAKDAIDRYGVSASASRLVAGERPVQRELEKALADAYGTEDCVVFVSGHATNVSTIATLFGPRDIVIHDSLIHNSVLEGVRLSGAARRSFPHNDTAALDSILTDIRGQFERALIVVEGHYSMDGDIPDLPALIAIKRRHACFLMVDEAHALGVLGRTGRGVAEHFGSDPRDVDIWMGTLSKTLAGCGGYVAGERALVEHLKYAAPGFVYSVGIAPPLAAASLTALRIMRREPERVGRLQENGRLFLRLAAEAGLDVGTSRGFSIIPVITGSSLKAVRLSGAFFEHGINVQPVIHPAVEEKAARLRFFLTETHTQADMRLACDTAKKLIYQGTRI